MKIRDIVLQFIKENWGIIAIYCILLLAVPITTILLPHYYGKFIDSIKDKKSNPKIILYIIAGLWILVVALNYASNYLDSYFKPKLQGYIRDKLMREILEKYKDNYKEQEVGDLISKIIKLPYTINDLFHEMKDYIMPIIFIFIFAIGYFFYINPYIGGITIVGSLIFFAIITFFLKKCIFSANEADAYADLTHEQISEMFENMSNVYASNMCHGEMERFNEYASNMRDKYSCTIKCSANFNLLFNISYLILFFAVCFMTFTLYKRGSVNLTQVVSVIIISLYVISYLSEATVEVRDFIYNLGSIEKMQEYLDELEELSVVKHSPELPIDIKYGDISVRGVEMTYPNSKDALFNNLNVNIEAGENIAIMGRIGSGKSSFVKMLLKFYPIQKGSIKIDGVDISHVSSDSLRQQIMYIPQNPSLFNRSLYENIAYGLDVSLKEVEELMRSTGASRLFNDFKLEDKVGKKGEKLSGGQKQMVYLLRAILKNSKIIILDEPTSALDENSKRYILDILKKIMRGKTVLIITHDPSVLKYVDRTIFFDKGKIL